MYYRDEEVLSFDPPSDPMTSPWWGQTEEPPDRQCHKLEVSAEEGHNHTLPQQDNTVI